jgi:hypothetical protein
MPHAYERTQLVADWRWKLRLFVSADLVGSTAFKAARSGDTPAWAPTFKAFFQDFPSAVEKCYDELPDGCACCSERLRPWKFSGDEILFWVELGPFCESATHLLAFKTAVQTFPELWKEKKLPLRLKATAWLAGFPVTNTEIEITTRDGGVTLDFIGPSIDLGFRLTKFADTRRMVLSADLALMILDAVDRVEIPREHFHLHLHGREVLKGVIEGEPYPVVWIDMRDGQPDIEERLLGIRRDFRSDDLKDFLRRFIDATPKLRRPFIAIDNDSRYNSADPELDKLREEMEAEELSRNYQKTEAEPAPQDTGQRKEPKPPKTEGLTLGYF